MCVLPLSEQALSASLKVVSNSLLIRTFKSFRQSGSKGKRGTAANRAGPLPPEPSQASRRAIQLTCDHWPALTWPPLRRDWNDRLHQEQDADADGGCFNAASHAACRSR